MESLLEDIVGFLFFALSWPGIIVALLLVPIGLALKSFKCLMTSSLLCLPFTYVLTLYTIWGLIIPACIFIATYLTYRKLYGIAAVAVIPVYIFVFYLAYAVFNQPSIS